MAPVLFKIVDRYLHHGLRVKVRVVLAFSPGEVIAHKKTCATSKTKDNNFKLLLIIIIIKEPLISEEMAEFLTPAMQECCLANKYCGHIK